MQVTDAAQIPCSCGYGVGQQLQLALIQPLAWEFPYAVSEALKRPEKKKIKNKKKKKGGQARYWEYN